MNIKKIATILALILQTACHGNLKHLAQRENELKFRNDYNSYLSREYLKYSRNLLNQKIKNGSDYYAGKGLKAANNQQVYPEVLQSSQIDPQLVEEFIISRRRLDLLMNPETKSVLPIQLAHLVMLHDCWVNDVQKGWNFGSLGKCHIRFSNLLDEMEEVIHDLHIKKDIEVVNIKEPEFEKFEIYFDFNSYRLNRNANKEIIDLIAHLENLNGDFRVLLSGNADRSGKKIYNASLARKRVLVIQDILIKNGVPKDVIEIASYGEIKPEIITKNSKQNKYNRLVGIYVLKGTDSLSAIPLPLIDNYIYKKEIKMARKRRGIN